MRLSLYSVVAVVIAFAMGYGISPKQLNTPAASTLPNVVTEGAYRDGLYVGRLHRRHGLPSHPALGRWNREADRHLFGEGYDRGYSETQE
ncbi:MAG TPA: hypothetical protein VMT53_12730 [Terriglobales bacterium]|nr:hypothetical protein [Terriglobales bacterium]